MHPRRIESALALMGRVLRLHWFWLLPLLLVATADVTGPLTDSFHEGEYLGFVWHLRAYHQGQVPFPVLIHGGIDYLPSVVAAAVWGPDRIVTGTRIVNALATGAAWALFLALGLALAGADERRRPWTLGLAALFLVMAPRVGATALEVQQAFVGVRDLFLLAGVWLVHRSLAAGSPRAARTFLALAGVATAVATFWCYDRGLMAVAFFGAAMGGAALSRRWLDAAMAGAAWLAATLALGASRLMGTVAENVATVAYWVRAGAEIWGYAASKVPTGASLGVPVTLAVGAGACLLVAAAAAQARRESWRGFSLLAGLLLVQLLLVKTAANRAGTARVSWILWPTILLLLSVAPRLLAVSAPPAAAAPPAPGPAGRAALPGRLTVVLAALCLVAGVAYARPPLVRLPSVFVRAVMAPKPDVEVVEPAALQAGLLLRAAPGPCTFNWTNDGVIGLLSRKPLCGPFGYAIYASRAKEETLLKGLQERAPAAVVIDTGQKAMSFDGRPMDERLPAVGRWLREAYPATTAVGGYVVASRPGGT